MQDTPSVENTQLQMRKGILEFCILLIISRGKIYASDILQELKSADLLVVEGTLYPLLSRLKNRELLAYTWEESKNGPPRKYFTLTSKGHSAVEELQKTWQDLSRSINSLGKKYEKNN